MLPLPAHIPIRRGGTKKTLGEIIAYALVDQADFDYLSQYRWTLSGDGYAVGSVTDANGKRTVQMHRLVLGLEYGDPRQGDHINRQRLDNRRANLRATTALVNGKNKSSYATAASPFVGVHPRKRGGYIAYVTNEGVRTHLGAYAREEDAALVAAHARAMTRPGVHGRDLSST